VGTAKSSDEQNLWPETQLQDVTGLVQERDHCAPLFNTCYILSRILEWCLLRVTTPVNGQHCLCGALPLQAVLKQLF